MMAPSIAPIRPCLGATSLLRGCWRTWPPTLRATQPGSTICACGDPENGDGDHFYCVPKTSGTSPDLTNAFKSAINQLVGGTKLIQLP